MVTNFSIKRRKRNAKRGIGMPGDNNRILEVARRLRGFVDAPVIGGIAVYLRGGGRSTVDLDFYAADRAATVAQLEAAGASWNKSDREHILNGVRIHTISPAEAGITVDKVSVIDGVRVVCLKDLIAIKLLSGLKNSGRSRDLGDVEDLIRSIPLDKRFAAKLPKEIRPDFKTLVDAVRANSHALPRNRRF